MNTLFSLTFNEIIKLKRTPAIYLSLLGALLIHFLFFGMRIFKTEYFLPDEGVNPWTEFTYRGFMQSSFMLLPMFIIIITGLIHFTEHKAQGWKQLLVMPVKKGYHFFSKFIALNALLIFTFLLFDIFLIINGLLLGWIKPELNFLSFMPDFALIVKLTSKLFLVSLSVMSIQFWLSMRLKNLVVPVGIGMALVISGMVLMNWEKIIYFPYIHHYLEVAEQLGRYSIPHIGRFSLLEITNLLVTVVAVLAGFYDFTLNKKVAS